MTVDASRSFDLDRAWRMHSQVAIRPERFGALAYHFGTRRLSFLKSRKLLAVVEALADHNADMATAVETAEREFGGVDAIIAAAGVIAGGVPLWEMPIAEQEGVLEVDLHAVLVAARVGIPALLRRPEPRCGRFIAVASAAATRGLPMLAAYCAAKPG